MRKVDEDCSRMDAIYDRSFMYASEKSCENVKCTHLPGVGIKGYEGHASMWEYRILLERFLDSALLALGDFSADTHTHTLPLAA